MLIVLIFVMVGLMVAMMAIAPAIATAVKRDKEQEMIHRGAQYARAIKKYYKKFGRYPANLEALENTNNVRFLRKRYKDPFSQDGKWQLVRYGQVQFDATQRQGGAGFSGSVGLPNVPGVTGLLQGQPQSAPTQQSGSTFGQSGSTGSSQPVGGSFGQSSSSSSSQPVGGSFGQSSSSSGNQAFGGGAIIGVASTSERESLRIVAEKNHYKDWKFIYDPTFDRGALITGPYDPKKQLGQFAGGSGPGQQIGQPIGSQQQGTGTGSSFGQSQQNPMQQPYQPPDQAVSPNPR